MRLACGVPCPIHIKFEVTASPASFPGGRPPRAVVFLDGGVVCSCLNLGIINSLGCLIPISQTRGGSKQGLWYVQPSGVVKEATAKLLELYKSTEYTLFCLASRQRPFHAPEITAILRFHTKRRFGLAFSKICDDRGKLGKGQKETGAKGRKRE